MPPYTVVDWGPYIERLEENLMRDRRHSCKILRPKADSTVLNVAVAPEGKALPDRMEGTE